MSKTSAFEEESVSVQTMVVCPFCPPFEEEIWVVNLKLKNIDRLKETITPNEEFLFALVQCKDCSSIDSDELVKIPTVGFIGDRFRGWIASVCGLIKKSPRVEMEGNRDCVLIWNARSVFNEIDFGQQVLRRQITYSKEALSCLDDFTMDVVSKTDLQTFWGI